MVFFFFFKQKTAYEIVDCDWSSDVCSSDLATCAEGMRKVLRRTRGGAQEDAPVRAAPVLAAAPDRKSVV